MRLRRLLLALAGALLLLAVASGWAALGPAAVQRDPLPAPIRISEPATGEPAQEPGPAAPSPHSAAPAPPSDTVAPPPLPDDDGDDDDGEDVDDNDDDD